MRPACSCTAPARLACRLADRVSSGLRRSAYPRAHAAMTHDRDDMAVGAFQYRPWRTNRPGLIGAIPRRHRTRPSAIRPPYPLRGYTLPSRDIHEALPW
jgi:hypothetical protein